MTLWPKNWIECFITTYATLVGSAFVLIFASRSLPPLGAIPWLMSWILFGVGALVGLISRRLRDDGRYQVLLTAALAAAFIAPVGIIR